MSENNARILVVEDEESLRELYVELLVDAGYDVAFAVDGKEGLSKLLEGGWNLTLLDIMMPNMDGMTVLEHLQKEKPKQINGPIILLTALSQESLVHKGLSLGAAGYLVKSEITPDQVLQEVHNFLESAKN